jgi:sensor c-di-GMP phosphodiesterase-like protein
MAHLAMIGGMARLRQHGFRFYIDDFGTGYSNFAYLAELPLDGIKMDRRFTRAIGTQSASSQIIDTICAMAKSLKIDFVVEGVETQSQIDHMARLMPDAVGQGWHIGLPVRAQLIPLR